CSFTCSVLFLITILLAPISSLFPYTTLFRSTLGGLLPKVRKMGWVAFTLMIIGTVLAASQIAIGEASVLYTFYPPMAASPWFYIGLVLVVLGVWTAAFGAFSNVIKWKKDHRGQHLPLMAFFGTGIFVLLFTGTLGVTYEV